MSRRVLAIAALAAAVAALGAVSLGSPPRPELRASFTSAVNVIAGQEVRLHGVQVGEVASVEERDGLAVVSLRIDDDRAWPLHDGTRAQLRFGTTVSYAARYVELRPGPPTARELADGGLIEGQATSSAVEFDDMFSMFGRRTRRDLGRLVDGVDRTFAGSGAELKDGLREAGPALDETAELLRRLGDDRGALRQLVVAGARSTGALAAHDAQLRNLVTGAAGTFDAMASEASSLRVGINRYPSTLREAQRTLARVGASSDGLRVLAADLGPGARRLRALGRPLSGFVNRLFAVSPSLSAALRATTDAAPAVTSFLNQASPFMTELGDAAAELVPSLACLRPYSPEIAGFLGTWAGFTKNYDAQDHYLRTLLQVPPSSDTETRNSEQFIAQSPGQTFALPRVPGLNAGQPWLLDSCGAGPSALDPAKDPESRPAAVGAP